MELRYVSRGNIKDICKGLEVYGWASCHDGFYIYPTWADPIRLVNCNEDALSWVKDNVKRYH